MSIESEFGELTRPEAIAEWLSRKANWIRLSAMSMTHHARLGHTGGDLSSADILATLFLGRVLRIDPANPQWPKRDRFVMSKGHCSAAFYSTLASRGFFPIEQLKTFMDPLSMLNGHPDRNKLPGVEANTGPLGHGMPIAVGMALAARMKYESWRVFVLVGDGELQEGSNWEAALTAAHYKLDNLCAIIDNNKLQITGPTSEVCNTDPIDTKFESFGWVVRHVDGHDLDALKETFDELPFSKGKPSLIIAHTVKGKGISYMENAVKWHHGVPDEKQYHDALAELDSALITIPDDF